MISVIVPAYMEGKILEHGVLAIRNEMEKISRLRKESYEIIVSAEGKDETPDIMKRLMEKYRNLKFAYSKTRLGKGGGIEHGISFAKGDKIIFMDVDISVDPSYALRMLDMLHKYDIVVASRYTPFSKIQRSGTRIFLGNCYSLFIRVLLQLGVRDAQCGFKVFKADTLKKSMKYVQNKSVFWDTEMLFIAKHLGYKIGEIPVNWCEREGKSNISISYGLFGVLPNVIKLHIRSWFKKNKPRN